MGEELMRCLWQTWEETPAVGDPGGSRLFVRQVQFIKGSGFWDWTLVGHVKAGVVYWVEGYSKSTFPGAADGVLSGDASGSWYDERVGGFQWVLADGDGPSGERVADWAGYD